MIHYSLKRKKTVIKLRNKNKHLEYAVT